MPSVVYGLLGLTVFVAFFAAVGAGNGRNLLAAMMTLGVLVLPIVIITSAEALRAVPNAIREAGYGVGARAGRSRASSSCRRPCPAS